MTNDELIAKLKTIVQPYIQDEEAFANLNEDTDFINDLTSKEPKMVENAGFIRNKAGIIQTYIQYKKGMTFFMQNEKCCLTMF